MRSIIANCQLIIANWNKRISQTINNQPLTINNPAFTLVELLVVVALVGIIGTITTQVFIIGFRSQAKGEMVKEVKQNGDYALSVIETMVRSAVDFSPDQACNEDSTTLSIINQDGNTTIFDCDLSTNFNIASISVLPTTTPGINPTGVSLTSNKVAISSCNFRVVCPTPPLSPKYVFVDFTVTQGTIPGQPTPLPENTASVEYQGTYSLGNYQ